MGYSLQFLLVTFIVAACLGEGGADEENRCAGSDAEVLILGAGMAGISAAKTLSEGNVTNFLVLEAENRIGGRVKNTLLQSGVRVELGANWIQGIDPHQPEKHPLWQIAQRCGGLEGRYQKTFSNGTMHVFDQDGNNITGSEVYIERLAKYNKILDPGLGSYSEQRQKENQPDISVREAFEDTGWHPTTPLDQLIEWNGFDLDEYATTPEHTSLYENYPDDTYADFGDNPINYLVTDQEEGFVKVVRCLADEVLTSMSDPRLHLGSTVTEVDWSNPQCVCVTSRENGTLRDYCAPHAILTFSLGVLKSDAVSFVPELPQAKRNAITSLDYILYLKIFMEFQEVFWKKEIGTDSVLRVDPVRGHYVQFQPLGGPTPVLFFTVTGDTAKQVYHQSLEETTAQIMKALRVIYGSTGVPDPISVTVPDWWVNPLYRGTYSNVPPGFGDQEMEDLQAAEGRLHFGGEATSDKYSGYVHGAYFSGIDVAKQVVREMENSNTRQHHPDQHTL